MIPTLSIQVEGIQHNIVQALSTYHEDYTRMIQEEIEALDIDSMIRLRVRMVAPNLIQNAIDKSVEKAVQQAMSDARFNDRMGEIVRGAINGALDGAGPE